MVTDKWIFIAMELENRDLTKDKAKYLKSIFGNGATEKVVGLYDSIAQVKDKITRRILYREFVEENFPNCARVLKGEVLVEDEE